MNLEFGKTDHKTKTKISRSVPRRIGHLATTGVREPTALQPQFQYRISGRLKLYWNHYCKLLLSTKEFTACQFPAPYTSSTSSTAPPLTITRDDRRDQCGLE